MSVDPQLRKKLVKAAKAILDSHSLLITSGSGMTAECKVPSLFPDDKAMDTEKHISTTNGLNGFPDDGLMSPEASYSGGHIPILRGTSGLWSHFPLLKAQRVLFEDLLYANFFRQHPRIYWYVYGHIINRLGIVEPH
jgi:NAD-dependent SIR2 family protein deacetylase